MPCTGPSRHAALSRARTLTNEVLALLRSNGIGANDLDTPNGKFSFKDELKTELLRVVEEIVWDDDCAGF